MEENQVTTPVEETPAEPVNESTQNKNTQNEAAQGAVYVPMRQAKTEQIHVPALVMGILSIIFPIRCEQEGVPHDCKPCLQYSRTCSGDHQSCVGCDNGRCFSSLSMTESCPAALYPAPQSGDGQQ